MEDIFVTMHVKQRRFEINIVDDIGYLEYRWYQEDIPFMHTFIPEAGRGKGHSAALAKTALEYAKSKTLKITVYCPFVSKCIKLHPEYTVLIKGKFAGR